MTTQNLFKALAAASMVSAITLSSWHFVTTLVAAILALCFDLWLQATYFRKHSLLEEEVAQVKSQLSGLAFGEGFRR